MIGHDDKIPHRITNPILAHQSLFKNIPKLFIPKKTTAIPRIQKILNLNRPYRPKFPLLFWRMRLRICFQPLIPPRDKRLPPPRRNRIPQSKRHKINDPILLNMRQISPMRQLRHPPVKRNRLSHMIITHISAHKVPPAPTPADIGPHPPHPTTTTRSLSNPLSPIQEHYRQIADSRRAPFLSRRGRRLHFIPSSTTPPHPSHTPPHPQTPPSSGSAVKTTSPWDIFLQISPP